MARLFLIRHAEPLAAWGGGDSDPGLSPRGQAQAEAAAVTLRTKGPLVAMSSPMRRCRETALAFSAAPSIEARVSEVAAATGITNRQEWLKQNFPWAEGVPRRRWSDASADLRQWRDDVLAAILAVETDTAVFTHFIAINAILSAASGVAETIVARPAHASITEIDTTGGVMRLVRMGAEMDGGEVR